MATTVSAMEARIALKTTASMPRTKAIDKLVKGAEKGAREAEKVVFFAQQKLTTTQGKEKRLELTRSIARNGRLLSLELHDIAVLKEISKRDTAAK